MIILFDLIVIAIQVLVGLYEEPERPPNAVDYIKVIIVIKTIHIILILLLLLLQRYMGAPTGIDVEALRQENEQLKLDIQARDAQIKELNTKVGNQHHVN